MSLAHRYSENYFVNFGFAEEVKLGNFVFDRETRTLHYQDYVFHLRDKIFQLLDLLVESEGRLVYRDAIISYVWKDNYYVGQNSLTNAICMLRKMFAKDPGKSVIVKTTSKVGYRLVTT